MINIISAISAAGMAIGTAALILILSVYNGFDKIIKANMSDLDPDVLVTAAEGKHFVPEGEAWDALMDDRRVASITSVARVWRSDGVHAARGRRGVRRPGRGVCDGREFGFFVIFLLLAVLLRLLPGVGALKRRVYFV